MKNIFRTKVNKDDTLARKALWLAGFVILFMVCYIGLELLWNRFITGKGFWLDEGKLPGEIFSAFFIGWLTMYFITHSSKNAEEKI